MGGPSSWDGAKRRRKRPQTVESKLSLEQRVGRVRMVVSKPEAPPPVMGISKRKPAGRAAAVDLSKDDKRLRNLNKVLRQIEELQRRSATGEDLDEQQLEKVGRLDDVLEEMEGLMAGGAGDDG